MSKESTIKKKGKAGAFWLPWVGLLLLLWLLLAEGSFDSLWFFFPVVLAAFSARRALPIPVSPLRFDFIKAVLFVPWFVFYSVAAGTDVALRALAPGLPIRPRMATYPLRLRSTGPCVFLSQVISLMPGTLTCELDDRVLVVHALNGTEEKIVADIARLEKRVAAIFREQLGVET